MRLIKSNAEAINVPGKQLVVADTLSRNPLQDSGASDNRLDAIKEATSQDADLQTVIHYTNIGWPVELSHILHTLHKYHVANAHLSVLEGILLYNDR